MALYLYLKAAPAVSIPFKQKRSSNIGNIGVIKFMPYVSILSGLILIATIILPIFSYKLMILAKSQKRLIAPISETAIAEAKGLINPLGGTVLAESTEQSSGWQTEFTQEVDYNLINNWFPTAPLPQVKSSKITHYTLSIPKLKIKDAIVAIGSDKVKESLIHYPGTALPGEYGNTVVFGHSVLPMFFNAKNYETIFSNLPTLDKGDKIYLYFDGIEYVYQVEDYFEIKPEEVQVLEQRFNEQVLSLITCVPPGTYYRRGVIKARLISI